MSKDYLEAIKHLDYLYNSKTFRYTDDWERFRENYDAVKDALLSAQKEHKAFEIIKEKKVNIGRFYHVVFLLKAGYDGCKRNNGSSFYNICDPEKGFITEDEFYTLKEVLEQTT